MPLVGVTYITSLRNFHYLLSDNNIATHNTIGKIIKIKGGVNHKQLKIHRNFSKISQFNQKKGKNMSLYLLLVGHTYTRYTKQL